jgi:hypothetical protein
MLLELGDLYLKMLESFVVAIGMVGEFFVRRVWLLPAIPVGLLVIVFSFRARRAPPAPSEEDLRMAQRRSLP